MNTIYSYKYVWFIEFLIFISLCNDIYASPLTQTLSLKQSTEAVKKKDIIFQRTCETFGFSQKQLGLHYKCFEMVWSLEPNLNPSDMEEVANNVKSWKISLVDARELLNILIKYKWGVTEYGLFLQNLYKYPDRMNRVKNVMEAMPWEQWKFFCDEKLAKRFGTYEIMPFILTPKEDLEELTYYMKMIQTLVRISEIGDVNTSIQGKKPTEVQQYGCPYPFVSAVIDLKNKKAGQFSRREIDDIYQQLCQESHYEKWDLSLFTKLCNEVGNIPIRGQQLKNIIMFGYKVVETTNHYDDSEKLTIQNYALYLDLCENTQCKENLSEFLVNILINTWLDDQTLHDIIERCLIEYCEEMELLQLLSTISCDIVNVSINQRVCYKNLGFHLYNLYKSDTTIDDNNKKILKIKNITALMKINKWNICDYNKQLEEVSRLKMNLKDYQDFIKANPNETQLNKLTEILVYISKLEIENIWIILEKMKLESNYKFASILQWKDSEIATKSLKYFFSVDKPMDCYIDILKGIILYNIRIRGNLSEDQHNEIYKMLCPIKDDEKVKRIVQSLSSDKLLAKTPVEYISALKSNYGRTNWFC